MAILNLNQMFPIVDPKTGRATDYFMHMLRGVTGPVGDAATDIATLFGRNLTAGTGLTGGGDLTADRTFAIDTTAEAERIRDVIGAALVAGSNITITIDDGADTITIAASGGGGGDILIERYVAGGTDASKTFTIPSGHTALKIKAVGRTTNSSAQNLLLRLNGDTGSNYVWQLVQAANTAATGVTSTGTTSLIVGTLPGSADTTSSPGVSETTLFRYTDTTFHKAVHGTHYTTTNTSTSNQIVRTHGGTWRSTAAVTSMTLFPGAGNFAAGSVIEVWGVG